MPAPDLDRLAAARDCLRDLVHAAEWPGDDPAAAELVRLAARLVGRDRKETRAAVRDSRVQLRKVSPKNTSLSLDKVPIGGATSAQVPQQPTPTAGRMDTANPPPRPAANVVLPLAGVLLVAAAGLKALSDATTGVVLPGVSATWLHVVSIAYQLALGGWLLSGSARPGAWLVAALTFAAFLAVSLYNVWVGSASCGCFGELSVHPWWAAGLDVAVLMVLLTLGRPRTPWRQALVPAGAFAANFALVVGLLTGWATYVGSTERGLGAVRGDAVVVEPAVLDFGNAAGGSTLTGEVRVTNRGDVPISVVGGTSDCSCATVGPLPVEVPPGESRPVRIALRLPKEAGQVRRTSQLWTDAAGNKSRTVGLVGRSLGGE